MWTENGADNLFAVLPAGGGDKDRWREGKALVAGGTITLTNPDGSKVLLQKSS